MSKIESTGCVDSLGDNNEPYFDECLNVVISMSSCLHVVMVNKKAIILKKRDKKGKGESSKRVVNGQTQKILRLIFFLTKLQSNDLLIRFGESNEPIAKWAEQTGENGA